MNQWGTCPTCGGPMDMYYEPWCPVCNKPSLEPKPVLNLIKALTHLEAIGHKGIKDRLWEWFYDTYQFSNDTLFWWNPEISTDINAVRDDLVANDMIVFSEAFGLREDVPVILEVSW